jgi:predicted GIY-YIG superfamily endonuclease
MKSGVYKIYFSNDKKSRVYIGISNNLKRRKNEKINSYQIKIKQNA